LRIAQLQHNQLLPPCGHGDHVVGRGAHLASRDCALGGTIAAATSTDAMGGTAAAGSFSVLLLFGTSAGRFRPKKLEPFCHFFLSNPELQIFVP